MNGWYNHPVGVSFAGSDATSGLAGCSTTTYSGPDSGNASVAGTCTDNAGNVGNATMGSVRRDPAERREGDREAWRPKRPAGLDDLARHAGRAGDALPGLRPSKLIYRGAASSFRDKGLRPGVKYKYTVTAFDPAGNSASKALA